MAEPITVTERAAKRINEIVASEKQPKALRVSVLGGGCSGFQYEFSLDDAKQEDDVEVVRNGAVVRVDSMSMLYMIGSEIDFEDSLIGASFKVNNPQATSSCGCGTSFSI
ncbi:iron-sulfur cluster insertion protein ErpA [Rhodoligotrophos defluvii]|uniref:iron-sulfur cluster insertion protein ErpA n=1 Tax=Rhodoligotrophos defluvii TaxID=2561934 RepID=UPI0010C9692B|nr:iron-sulfur cluster insertion protein ErpA [Rhodoligotrophos defluvii]